MSEEEKKAVAFIARMLARIAGNEEVCYFNPIEITRLYDIADYMESDT